MLAHLVVNGSLVRHGLLFWDEPEASLNPKLAEVTAGVVFELAQQGVQTFLATHDYALASELDLLSTQRDGVDIAFFGLAKSEDRGVTAERATHFTALRTNPVLDALGSLHERELEAPG